MGEEKLPRDVSAHVGPFDRFARAVSHNVSRAWFFSACVLLIVVWAPTTVLMDFNTSQLLVNTATTIVTFLLVALLQNATTRSDKASQHKLNAICNALRFELAGSVSEDEYDKVVADLSAAVGLEDRESS